MLAVQDLVYIYTFKGGMQSLRNNSWTWENPNELRVMQCQTANNVLPYTDKKGLLYIFMFNLSVIAGCVVVWP